MVPASWRVAVNKLAAADSTRVLYQIGFESFVRFDPELTLPHQPPERQYSLVFRIDRMTEVLEVDRFGGEKWPQKGRAVLVAEYIGASRVLRFESYLIDDGLHAEFFDLRPSKPERFNDVGYWDISHGLVDRVTVLVALDNWSAVRCSVLFNGPNRSRTAAFHYGASKRIAAAGCVDHHEWTAPFPNALARLE